MKPLKRMKQNKSHGAKQFKRHVGRTKAPNLAPPPMRGGFRM